MATMTFEKSALCHMTYHSGTTVGKINDPRYVKQEFNPGNRVFTILSAGLTEGS